MATSLPSGIVTFLFSDIEGSTRLWEQYPDAMKTALARHDSILHEAVESNGGHFIKTTGDGIHAGFDAVADGISATLRAQQALNAEPWNEIRPARVRVRMGLHTGEAELRAGDYYGAVLNRTARLMSVAHGGQILLSNVTAELVRDKLPADATLLDLGEHRLKDLIRPERVFQLVHASLGSEFPPLQTLDSFPNNLPIPLTSFIGRERELGEAKQKLASTRLLTLIGSGGTGKTRLSLQLAADLVAAFPDGVWFVELAPLADPAIIPQTIASVFGVREQIGMPLMDIIFNYLRAKRILLILDNCEHLVESCAKLAEQFMHDSPNLKIVASSREALGISGETVYPVPSLSFPEPAQVSPEALAHYEAVQLFVERAVAANPKFRLTEKNAPYVAQICRRLDGIPLALELAAARVTLFAPEQIAARLDDRFRLLTGGSRTAVPRQQTLRAMIDWSYEILGEPERALLRQLSVFAGGWTFEAAETISPNLDVLNLLAQLVNKSLVVVEDEGAETRYRLLETIRQYGRDKLLDAGEAERARSLHLAYFVDFAERGGEKIESSDILDWLLRLDAEHDNFRIALEWARDHNVEAALQLVGALSPFWFRRGLTVEGLNWISEALGRAETLPKLDGTAASRQMRILANAWLQRAKLAYTNDNALALKASLTCAALARQLNDAPMLIFSLCVEGSTRVIIEDPEAALPPIEEALKLARATGAKYELGIALGAMAEYSSLVLKDSDPARAYEEEGLALLGDSETSWGVVRTLFTSARNAMLRGDYAAARARFLKSLPAFEQIGDQHRVNMIHSELAHMDRYEGRHQQAAAAYRKTILVWQKLGHRAAIAHQLESFAFVAKALAQAPRAARLFGAAEALREKIGIPMNPQEHDEYEREVAGLHVQMDEGSFASSWAEGRNMTMEQAISYAIDKSDS